MKYGVLRATAAQGFVPKDTSNRTWLHQRHPCQRGACQEPTDLNSVCGRLRGGGRVAMPSVYPEPGPYPLWG